MMNELQKCAEILMECGYAKSYARNLTDTEWLLSAPVHYYSQDMPHTKTERPIPFYHAKDDSDLELAKEAIANRQADAIEDWLYNNERMLWERSVFNFNREMFIQSNQWRLDRIKWCILELCKA